MGRPAANPLGEFLRARRERVQPGDHGMPTPPNRRTPGLRREDVAVLAGVSTDYYVRLEQGRERHPSPQVIDALSGRYASTPTPAATFMILPGRRHHLDAAVPSIGSSRA